MRMAPVSDPPDFTGAPRAGAAASRVAPTPRTARREAESGAWGSMRGKLADAADRGDGRRRSAARGLLVAVARAGDPLRQGAELRGSRLVVLQVRPPEPDRLGLHDLHLRRIDGLELAGGYAPSAEQRMVGVDQDNEELVRPLDRLERRRALEWALLQVERR